MSSGVRLGWPVVALVCLTGAGCYLSHRRAFHEDDGGATPRPDGARPSAHDCNLPLQPGAPVPMLGYCSHRGYRTTADLPATAPSMLWGSPLGTSEMPAVSVDAGGRILATTASELIAFTPDGAVAFRTPMPFGGFGAPVLLRDGSILVTAGADDPDGRSRATFLTPAGVIDRVFPLFAGARGDPATLADGSLLYRGSGGTTLERFSLDGASRPFLVPGPGPVPTPPAATGDDWYALFEGPDPGAVRLTAWHSGAVVWERNVQGRAVGGPAIDDEGDVTIVLGLDDSFDTEVLRFARDGEERLRVRLGRPPTPAPFPLVIAAPSGVALVRVLNAMVAVEHDGDQRWQHAVAPDADYAVAVDPAGRVLLSSRDLVALTLPLGNELWRTAIFPPCPGPPAIAPGRIYFTNCDGMLIALGESGTTPRPRP